MSSNIAAIYSALAAKEITVNGVSITGYSGSTIPNAVDGRLPVRVLSSLTGYLFENVTNEDLWMTGVSGRRKQMTWQIADLMLWEPAGTGTGPAQFEPALLSYISQYADMLAADTALQAAGCMQVHNTWANGIYEYPPESGRFYYGSLVNLEIVEKWG